jgi:hypothetical protein
MLFYGHNGDGGKTAAAGTRIRYLIPPDPKRVGKTKVTLARYISAGTPHTLTFARPIGRTTVSAVAAAGQAVVNITADPGVTTGLTDPFNGAVIGPNTNAIAANDLVAIRETDGVTRFYTVQSVSTLAITLTGNLVKGCAAGDAFWNFGIVGDTDPRTGSAHPALLPPVSATTTYQGGSNDGAVLGTIGTDEPILVDSGNAAAAGTIDQLSWAYAIN